MHVWLDVRERGPRAEGSRILQQAPALQQASARRSRVLQQPPPPARERSRVLQQDPA